MNKLIPVILLLSASIVPVALAENELPPQVTLPQFLELVRAHNPGLQAERTQIEAADAEVKSARALPNPSVAFGTGFRVSQSRQPREREYSIEQELPVFGRRGAGILGAKRGAEAARAGVEKTITDTLREASSGFTSLLIAQEREKRWRDVRVDLDQAARIVAGQVEAGARSRYDLARIEIERASLSASEAQAQAATQEIAAKLAELVGAASWRPVALGSAVLPAVVPDFETLWTQAQDHLPSVKAARAELLAAEQRVTMARREVLPVPTVGLSQLRDSDGGREAAVSVSVSLPIFDRNKGGIAHAQAEAKGLRLRSKAALISAEVELRRATEQFARQRELTRRYEADAVTKVPLLRQMAEDAYRLGQAGILDLIDAIQSSADKQIAYLELLEAVLQAEVDVFFAAGVIDRPAGE